MATNPLSPSTLLEVALNATATIYPVQILHVKLWYADGQQRELNLTSPRVLSGNDIEVQYIYIRMYLQKVAHTLGITAYQGHIAYMTENEVKVIGTFEKTDCSTIIPFGPRQYCDCGKKEVRHG